MFVPANFCFPVFAASSFAFSARFSSTGFQVSSLIHVFLFLLGFPSTSWQVAWMSTFLWSCSTSAHHPIHCRGHHTCCPVQWQTPLSHFGLEPVCAVFSSCWRSRLGSLRANFILTSISYKEVVWSCICTVFPVVSSSELLHILLLATWSIWFL